MDKIKIKDSLAVKRSKEEGKGEHQARENAKDARGKWVRGTASSKVISLPLSTRARFFLRVILRRWLRAKRYRREDCPLASS